MASWQLDVPSAFFSALESVLLPNDRAKDIRQSIFNFSSHLTDRNDAIWVAWHEASYLQPIAASPSYDDAMHISRRRQFRPLSRPSGKTRFYAIRVGRKIGIFPSWKDDRRQVNGISRPEYGSLKPVRKLRPFSPPLQWCLRVRSSAPAMLSSLMALHPLARLMPPNGDSKPLIRLAESLMKTGAPSVSTLPLLSLLVPLVTPITLES